MKGIIRKAKRKFRRGAFCQHFAWQCSLCLLQCWLLVFLVSLSDFEPSSCSGSSTQLLAYNKSSYEFVLFFKYVGEKKHNSSSWTHSIVVFHLWQLLVMLNFVKDVGYFIKVNKGMWNECSKRKTLLFFKNPKLQWGHRGVYSLWALSLTSASPIS